MTLGASEQKTCKRGHSYPYIPGYFGGCRKCRRRRNAAACKKIDYYQQPKGRARSLVAQAIRSKRLLKEPCLVCGETRSYAHHEDHSQPLVVLWLCAKHHNALHILYGDILQKLNEEQRNEIIAIGRTVSQRELSEKYGVSQQLISNILVKAQSMGLVDAHRAKKAKG